MQNTTLMAAEPVDRLLRARDVMHLLGVSRSTAYRLMADGTLPVVRFGGSACRRRIMIRVRESSLQRWLVANESTEPKMTY